MNKEEFNIVVAGLLHDIGKFAQKVKSLEEIKKEWGVKTVEDGDTRTSDSKSKEYKKQININHEDITRKMLRNLFESDEFDFKSKLGAINWKPELFHKLGDYISAQEREPYEEQLKNRDIMKIPLISIFSLAYRDKIDFAHNPGIKHENLNLDLPTEEHYLKVDEKTYEAQEKVYDIQHFNNFVEELKKLSEKYDEKGLSDNRKKMKFLRELLDLMKKYLINIPSASFYGKPIIDLYSHSKMTAAIALCLKRLETEKVIETKDLYKLKEELEVLFFDKLKGKNDKKEEILNEINKNSILRKEYFLIIKGDLSGIQNFISTISTTKAMKTLRGRSFYLLFLNKLFALKLLRDLDLPETNLIFASGGPFEIIAPNSKKTIKTLKSFTEETNKKLFELFKTQLFLEISYKKMSSMSFHPQEYSKIRKNDQYDWEKVSDKSKKFIELIKEKNLLLEEGKFAECPVCSSEMDNADVCEKCKYFESLKRDLLKFQKTLKFTELEANKMLFYENELKDLFYDYEIALNDAVKDKGVGIFEFIPLGIKEGSIDEFNKIGALKFDVDNLGKLFLKGMERYFTLSTNARVSSDLTLFFEGKINKMWEKYKGKIEIIYSGGDDGFIIGDWKEVLCFAREVYNYFRIFTKINPKLTLSASYGIYNNKYPVKKIFEELEDNLEKAKSYTNEKNKISVLGRVLKWNYVKNFNIVGLDSSLKKDFYEDLEYEKIRNLNNTFEFSLKLGSHLSYLVNDKKIPRGLLNILVISSNSLLNSLERKKELNLRNIYYLNYYLKRNSKISDEDSKLIYDLLKKTVLEKYKPNSQNTDLKEFLNSVLVATQIAKLNTLKKEEKITEEVT